MSGRSATNRALAGAAALLGAAALFGGSPYGDAGDPVGDLDPRGEGRVEIVRVAEWIRDRRADLRVLDLRTQAEFDEFHLPTARRSSPAGLDSLTGTGTTVVVYAGGDGQVLKAWAALTKRGITAYYLDDGVREWLTGVMNPRISTTASAAERAAFERTAEVSRYFGGLPRVDDDQGATQPTTQLLNRTRRRGCAF